MTHLLLGVSENRGEDVEGEEGEVVAEGIGSNPEGLRKTLKIGEPEQGSGEFRGERHEAITDREKVETWKHHDGEVGEKESENAEPGDEEELAMREIGETGKLDVLDAGDDVDEEGEDEMENEITAGSAAQEGFGPVQVLNVVHDADLGVIEREERERLCRG